MKYSFTTHAKERMKKRAMLDFEVIEVIKAPFMLLKKQGKYYAQGNIGRGCIEIVYDKKEKNINIITVYWI